MDKELGSRSLRRRKGGYTEEMKEAIANQDNMSYTQQFKPSGDSGSYRKTQTRDNSSVTPNTTGTTSFPDENSGRMHPTCNDPFHNPYICSPSPEANMTDVTNYSNDPNFVPRSQTYGEPYTSNPVRLGDSLTAYRQPNLSSTSYRADGGQWPPTALQPSLSSNPPITPFTPYSGQQRTNPWIFDYQRQKYYYVDTSDPNRPRHVYQDETSQGQ